MDQTKIMHADYLDILFGDRNKMYGSYELRKHYDQRVLKALLFIAMSVGIIACFALFTKHPETIVRPDRPIAPSIVSITPVIKPEQKKIQETLPPPPAKHVKTQSRTVPVIDKTDKVPDDKQMTQNKLVTNAPGIANADGDTADIISTTPAKITGSGNDITLKNTVPKKWVSQMPQFTGDMDAYIAGNLNYPEIARTANIEGTVLIQFIVNEDGRVSEATVVRSIGGGCDQEAQRVVRNMPKWVPGKQGNIPVKVYFTLPIKFVLK